MTSRAKRSGRIVPSALRLRACGSLSAAAAGRAAVTACGSPRWSSMTRSIRSRASSASSAGPSTRARSRSPSTHEISSRGLA